MDNYMLDKQKWVILNVASHKLCKKSVCPMVCVTTRSRSGACSVTRAEMAGTRWGGVRGTWGGGPGGAGPGEMGAPWGPRGWVTLGLPGEARLPAEALTQVPARVSDTGIWIVLEASGSSGSQRRGTFRGRAVHGVPQKLLCLKRGLCTSSASTVGERPRANLADMEAVGEAGAPAELGA